MDSTRDSVMPAPRKYPDDLREESISHVAAAMGADPRLSLTAAATRIGPRLGVAPDTLRGWVKQAQVGAGRPPGTATSARATLAAQRSRIRALAHANGIVLDASSFPARERDPRLP